MIIQREVETQWWVGCVESQGLRKHLGMERQWPLPEILDIKEWVSLNLFDMHSKDLGSDPSVMRVC